MKKYRVERILTKMKKLINRKTNEKNIESRENYKDRIRKHKMAGVYRFLMVVAVLAILAIIVYVQYSNHIYTDFEYISEASINKVESARSLQLGSCILTYSNDGAHCTDMEGVEVWNQSYVMQSPIVEISGDVVAIADYNGREVYVLNTTERICRIDTTMPIKNIAVSASGRVAVEVIDGQETRIYIYKTDGTAAYEFKTSMIQSGYPAAFGFSPNGELLGVSYIFVDAGVVKSQVAFYNFGQVGSNKANFLVSGYTYEDVIVPYIRFMSEDMAVAVGDDRIIFYSGNQIPTLLAQHMLEDEEIQGIYQNGDHLGVLFRSDKLEMRNKMDVYKSDSQKMGTYYFNVGFHDIVFTKDYFVAYGDAECEIRTYDNVDKFSGEFDKSIDLLLPVGKGTGYKFVMVSGNSISTVQMR